MRIQLLSIGLLLCTAACGDDSVTGGGNTGGGNTAGHAAGGDNSGAGQVGGAGGDANGGQAPGGAPQGGGGGTSGDGGAAVGGAGGAPCEPITDDPSAIGDNCAETACPAGYTCQGMSGVIFQQTCVILCEQDCECPADFTCEMFSDKSTTWKACAGALN